MAKRKQLYSQKPVVSNKKVAGTNPVGVIIIGAGPASIVPDKSGVSRGITPKKELHQPKARGFTKSARRGHKLGVK